MDVDYYGTTMDLPSDRMDEAAAYQAIAMRTLFTKENNALSYQASTRPAFLTPKRTAKLIRELVSDDFAELAKLYQWACDKRNSIFRGDIEELQLLFAAPVAAACAEAMPTLEEAKELFDAVGRLLHFDDSRELQAAEQDAALAEHAADMQDRSIAQALQNLEAARNAVLQDEMFIARAKSGELPHYAPEVPVLERRLEKMRQDVLSSLLLTAGYTNTDLESLFVVPTLFSHTEEFMNQAKSEHPEWFPPGTDESFAVETELLTGRRKRNMRMYYNNFEIVHRSFLESEPYQAYVDYLDHKKGFYVERWGWDDWA
ncbi:hypothetical protein JCM10213v2_008761 [Rhodosporidiobolus nylandii]